MLFTPHCPALSDDDVFLEVERKMSLTLQYRAQLASMVMQRRDDVVRSCARRFNCKARTSGVERAVLRAHIAALVEETARQLAKSVAPQKSDGWHKRAMLAIADRFDVEEVAHQYGVLRRCLFRTVADKTGSLSLDATEALHSALDNVVTPTLAERLRMQYALLEREREAARASEAARLEAENKLQCVISALPVVLFAIDLDGRITLSEGRGLQNLGYAYGALCGHSAFEVYGHSPEAVASIKRALAGEEFTATARVDDKVWLEVRWTPVRNDRGELVGTTGLAIDVTDAQQRSLERNRLIRELAANEERLALAVKSADIGTWDFNCATRELHWDERARQLFSLRPDEEANYDRFLELIHPDDVKNVRQNVDRALDPTGNGEYSVEYRLARGPGKSELWVQAMGRCIFENGIAVRFTGTVLDVTQRKHQEQFRDRILGIVSHDLRNPLSVITTAAGRLLRAPDLLERYRGAALRIETSALRMENMISNVLDFARFHVGTGIPLSPEPTDLRALAQQLIQDLSITHPTRRIQLHAEGDMQGSWDPQRLRQVATNLLTNALRYSPPDTDIRVGLSGSADSVELRVTNDGVPIPPEQLETLFEPFRCGRSSHKVGGMGLGLYIVQHIVARQGGQVTVQSDHNGTEFTVTLPRHTQSVDSP